MTSQPTVPGPTFITPLNRDDLLDSGQKFPREELLRRVLSTFWKNCCGIPGLARAPAPVVELTSNPAQARAWWVLYDGIVEEREGPQSERIALFFGHGGLTGQLWPRYEFEVLEEPFAVELKFHQDPGLRWVSRIRLARSDDGFVEVNGSGRA